MADKLKVWRDAEAAVARVAERVSQGGQHIPEDVIVVPSRGGIGAVTNEEAKKKR